MAYARLIGALVGRARAHIETGADQREACILDDIDRETVFRRVSISSPCFSCWTAAEPALPDVSDAAATWSGIARSPYARQTVSQPVKKYLVMFSPRHAVCRQCWNVSSYLRPAMLASAGSPQLPRTL